jgi:hypothetical protein
MAEGIVIELEVIDIEHHGENPFVAVRPWEQTVLEV